MNTLLVLATAAILAMLVVITGWIDQQGQLNHNPNQNEVVEQAVRTNQAATIRYALYHKSGTRKMAFSDWDCSE